MSYGVSVAWQVSNFFMSMGLGFIVGLLYSLSLTLIWTFGASKVAYIIFDLIFSVISTLLFFCFSLIYSQGELRFINALAVGIGAIVFHLTVGKFILKFMKKLAARINKTIKLIFSPLMMCLRFLKNSSKNIINKCKKTYVKIKKRLTDKKNKDEISEISDKINNSKKIKDKKTRQKSTKKTKNKKETNKKHIDLLYKIHKKSKNSKKLLQKTQDLI